MVLYRAKNIAFQDLRIYSRTKDIHRDFFPLQEPEASSLPWISHSLWPLEHPDKKGPLLVKRYYHSNWQCLGYLSALFCSNKRWWSGHDVRDHVAYVKGLQYVKFQLQLLRFRGFINDGSFNLVSTLNFLKWTAVSFSWSWDNCELGCWFTCFAMLLKVVIFILFLIRLSCFTFLISCFTVSFHWVNLIYCLFVRVTIMATGTICVLDKRNKGKYYIPVDRGKC